MRSGFFWFNMPRKPNSEDILCVCCQVAVLICVFIIGFSNASSMNGWITSVTGELDSNASAVVGREVQLPCDITPPTPDDRTHLVLWYKQDSGNPIYTKDMRSNQSMATALLLANNDIRLRVSFQQDPHLISPYLLVKDVQGKDQGLYRCRVDFKKARSRNSHVHLNVIVPPQVPTILDEKGLDLETRIGPYNEGSSLFLSCEVVGGHPPPRVTWWRDGRLLDHSYEVTSLAIVRNDLMVKSLSRADFQGIFTCKASNNNQTEPVASSVTVDINLKPLEVTISSGKSEAVRVGKKYLAECRSSGSLPPALIEWWKEGHELKATEDKVSADCNVTTSTLTFLPAINDHNKTIFCRAKNPAIHESLIEDSWTLNVLYAPIVSLSPSESIRLNNVCEDDDVELECHFKANPLVVKVEWKFQGHLLTNNASLGLIINNQSLLIQKVKRSHSGSYSCLVTNTEGTGESLDVRLQVKHQPVCALGPDRVHRVATGETAEIQCKVEAFPTNVKFFWRSNHSGQVEESLFLQNSVMVNASSVTSTVTVTLDEKQDFGHFYCWGSNEVGIQKIPCVVKVELAGPPDPVNNCSIINQTQTVINVSCKSGYNGGLLQTFICDVIDADDQQIKRSMSSSLPLCLLDDLEPGVNYVISIYAFNNIGRSPGVFINIKTLKSELSDTNEKFTTIHGAIIGIVLTLVFISIIIFLFMKVKTSRNSDFKSDKQSEHSIRISAPLQKEVDICLENDEKSPDIICNTYQQDLSNIKVRCLEKWAYGAKSHCENCLRHQKLLAFSGAHLKDQTLLDSLKSGHCAGCSFPMRKIQPIKDGRMHTGTSGTCSLVV